MTKEEMKAAAKTVKFNVEFMLMMLSAGRNDAADKALKTALDTLDEMAGEGK